MIEKVFLHKWGVMKMMFFYISGQPQKDLFDQLAGSYFTFLTSPPPTEIKVLTLQMFGGFQKRGEISNKGEWSVKGSKKWKKRVKIENVCKHAEKKNNTRKNAAAVGDFFLLFWPKAERIEFVLESHLNIFYLFFSKEEKTSE